MRLGDVLGKERERKNYSADEIAQLLGMSGDDYQILEGGTGVIEDWGPKLAKIAVALGMPTSRLISESGHSQQARRETGQCGKLIKTHRLLRNLSVAALARSTGINEEEMTDIEAGTSPLESIAPNLLKFSEIVEQPIFNLFYPCGLPFNEIDDYP